MKADFEQRLAAVDPTSLTPPVRRWLGDETARLIDWHVQPLEGGFGDSYGVYRFHGQARLAAETRPWSLILKAAGPDQGSQDPSHWNYWAREALVYQSDLLADLPPGLAAPRCLGVETYPGDETWLWLEDVTETGPKAWPLDRYGLAAQHLGRFNGQYLTGKPLPTMPWLANSHIRQRIVDAEATIAELPQASQSPVFADLLAEDSLERMLTLWAARELLLARLNHLPQTLCHFDAFRRNLLNRPGPTGAAETVAIDWALTGPGVIGQELVALFHTSLTFTTFDLDQIPTLDQLIFQGYLAGLRESGWLGDPRLARFGFAASAALDMVANRAIKYPNVARRVAALPPEAELPRLLNPGGPAQYRAAERHLLALGDEAVSLLEVL